MSASRRQQRDDDWNDEDFAPNQRSAPRRQGQVQSAGRHFTSFPTPQMLRGQKYKILLADPPWLYSRDLSHSSAGGSAYAKMTLDQLKNMPVADISDSKSCLMFMWATFPKLIEAIELMQAWDFTYVTVAFVWVKTRGRFLHSGLGMYTKANAEIVLIGRRGKCPTILDKTVKQLVIEPLRVHSQKPDCVRALIDQLVGPNHPKIELFARFVPEGDPSGRAPSLYTEGWDSFGNGDFGQHQERARNTTSGESWQEAYQDQAQRHVASHGFQPPLSPEEEEFLENERNPQFAPPSLMYNPALGSRHSSEEDYEGEEEY